MSMQSEIARLGTFRKFEGDPQVWVTQLAHSGFYYMNETGRVRCFSCGREYRNFLLGSPTQNAHDLRCRWFQQNQPLSVGTQKLGKEELEEYFSDQPSQAASASNNFNQVGNGRELPRNRQNNGDETDGHFRSQAYSSGYASASGHGSWSGLTDMSEIQSVDVLRPQYHSEPTARSTVDPPSHAAHDGRVSAHAPPSLPQNVNQLSGPVVREERPEATSHSEVLTSATKKPVSLDNYPFQRRGAEQGASGGHDQPLRYDLSKASYPQFAAAQARMMTFSSWRPEHSHQPEDLVPAGFFYAGYADCVHCFYCGLGLKYWRDEDIPAYQHARFRPACVFNLMYKGQEYIDRVQRDFADQSQGTVSQNANPTSVTSTVPHQPTTNGVGEESVHMRSEAAQRALRDGWSRDQVRQAVEHVVRLYGPRHLQSSVLNNALSTLNPTEDSSDSSDDDSSDPDSDSDYDSVDSLAGAGAAVRVPSTAGEGGNKAPLVQQPATPQLDLAQEFRCVEREHTYLKERTTCQVCRIRPVSCVYLPCGHVIACQNCGDEASMCVFCNRVILGTATVYFA